MTKSNTKPLRFFQTVVGSVVAVIGAGAASAALKVYYDHADTMHVAKRLSENTELCKDGRYDLTVEPDTMINRERFGVGGKVIAMKGDCKIGDAPYDHTQIDVSLMERTNQPWQKTWLNSDEGQLKSETAATWYGPAPRVTITVPKARTPNGPQG